MVTPAEKRAAYVANPNLKISEAMKIGSDLIPKQALGCWGQLYIKEDYCSACAGGAVAYALSKSICSPNSIDMPPSVTKRWRDASDVFERERGFSIVRANDELGWTREAIAIELKRLGH
jgi:hypothetical protein